MNEQKTVFEFPCEFPIKVVGKAAPSFESTVMDIVRRHVPELTTDSVRSTGSKKGKFVSLTITIVATGWSNSTISTATCPLVKAC